MSNCVSALLKLACVKSLRYIGQSCANAEAHNIRQASGTCNLSIRIPYRIPCEANIPVHVKLNCPGQICPLRTVSVHPGEMAEWLKAHAWKACLGETLTWVRIPLSPPEFYRLFTFNRLQNQLPSWCLYFRKQ